MNDENNSYIKLFRKFLRWEWYEDSNTKDVFLHLLLIASWKDTKWRGIELKAGDLIRTNENIAAELKLSVQNVRTAISNLVSTGELTVKKVGKYRVITVKNWNEYQRINSKVTAKLTSIQQRSNSEVTAYKEDKEVKKGKNIYFVAVQERWNTLPQPISRVKKIAVGTVRHERLQALIETYGQDTVLEAIENIKRSGFLQGKGENGWVISFDWFLDPEHFQKVLEGNYTDKVELEPEEDSWDRMWRMYRESENQAG